jgi:hypothetical protein
MMAIILLSTLDIFIQVHASRSTEWSLRSLRSSNNEHPRKNMKRNHKHCDIPNPSLYLSKGISFNNFNNSQFRLGFAFRFSDLFNKGFFNVSSLDLPSRGLGNIIRDDDSARAHALASHIWPDRHRLEKHLVGILNDASLPSRAFLMRSSAPAGWPGLRTTPAHTTSPYFSSSTPKQTASETPSTRSRAESTSRGEIFSPPRLMSSLRRPVIWR